jgi:hypothetical protein
MAVHGTVVRPPWQQKLGAVVVFAGGLFFLKTYVYDVVQAAHRHEALTIYSKLVVLGPVFTLFGLVLMIAAFSGRGEALRHRLSDSTNPKRLRPAGWMLLASLFAVGAGTHCWLSSTLEGLGY